MKRSNRNRVVNFDSHVKTALSILRESTVLNRPLICIIAKVREAFSTLVFRIDLNLILVQFKILMK